jgi:hypothetical protein
VPSAIELIVDSYVKLNNRATLEELREHRQRLKDELQKKAGPWFDVGPTIRQVDEDLRTIEAGLERLRAGGQAA